MTPESELPRLIKLRRVAAMLDCSLRHVYTLCAQGRLERVSIGKRSSRVTRESLDRLIEDARRGPGS